MTHEQIDRLVRRANPIPEPDALEAVMAPALIDDQEEKTHMSTDARQSDGKNGLGRGVMVAIATGVAVLVAGVTFGLLSGNGEVASPGSSTTTAAPTTTTAPTTTSSTAAALPEFPPELTDLVQGADTWAVVLAASPTGEGPEMEAAKTAALDAGYHPGITDCDEGAAEALGLPASEYYITISVYFETEDDANAAQKAFAARGQDGVVAVVKPYCLD